MPRLPLHDGQTPDGRHIYNCDGPDCGTQRAPWGKGWMYYSSYKEIEDDPYGFPTFCSEDCVLDFRELQFHNGETRIIPDPRRPEERE